jgi:hypothetical protein
VVRITFDVDKVGVGGITGLLVVSGRGLLSVPSCEETVLIRSVLPVAEQKNLRNSLRFSSFLFQCLGLHSVVGRRDASSLLAGGSHFPSQRGEAALATVCSKLPNNLRKKRLIVCDTSVTCCCRISHIIDL